MHREIPCDYLYNAENHWGIPYNYHKEFWYKRLRYFVKRSWVQETIRESSKSYDQKNEQEIKSND